MVRSVTNHRGAFVQGIGSGNQLWGGTRPQKNWLLRGKDQYPFKKGTGGNRLRAWCAGVGNQRLVRPARRRRQGKKDFQQAFWRQDTEHWPRPSTGSEGMEMYITSFCGKEKEGPEREETCPRSHARKQPSGLELRQVWLTAQVFLCLKPITSGLQTKSTGSQPSLTTSRSTIYMHSTERLPKAG